VKNFLLTSLSISGISREPLRKKGNPQQPQERMVNEMKCCALCNEAIDAVEFQSGEAVELDNGEFWHVECYTEYYDEAPLGVLEAV
jgi:hypothetical protein